MLPRLVLTLSLSLCLLTFSQQLMAKQQLKVATFNVSMEAENYLPRGTRGSSQVLIDVLANGEHPQVKNIAAIIQRVRPDILLLNEFDYIENPGSGYRSLY